ncbi:coiled-coil domain-containing protein 50 isoform X3 [Pelodiscus sinensis]|uniref:coiled-coil domain-containing protein 50 isoform X3 n=1 Tax=Pelodiscus sinensis TaxID=13735 RepID=UPI003F6A7C4A
MAEISIDQSKLPGVKEVCRDFAVLEDHTLAHSLQEQEIEHHLATNVQRNRLVQHDLQVAKQLQEEEDRRARTQIQKRHKDIERQDCEIAQEIQVKLVIEAEQRRRQEEKDEDIARILQQKELQEEKKRKKHHPDPPGLPLQEDSYYAENGGMRLRGTQEAVYAKPRVAFRDQELTDAEIARKLQEEELLANQVDPRAAQVAQDEEIARLLMAEEKKAYKKTKEREKSSSEKKRQDQEWRQDPGESARPRSRDRHEPQRPKSDRPARPPPPSVAGVDDFDHTRGFASPPSSVRQFSKPESSPKGFHYKQ